MDEEIISRIEDDELELQLINYYKINGKQDFMSLMYKILGEMAETFVEQPTIQLEMNCPAIMSLWSKNELSHQERTAAMMAYMNKIDGEKRLRLLLSKQKNYKKHITDKMIDYYKKKGLNKGITCEKLREWNVCNINSSDCRRFKNDKS